MGSRTRSRDIGESGRGRGERVAARPGVGVAGETMSASGTAVGRVPGGRMRVMRLVSPPRPDDSTQLSVGVPSASPNLRLGLGDAPEGLRSV